VEPSKARLVAVRVPREPVGAVIVLHGGGSRPGSMRVSPAQLSVVRMIPVARAIARAGGGRLAVYRLLNSFRGWDSRHTPVQDAEWALCEVRDRLGAVPVCLVGHSMGGRAAVLTAGHSAVVGVVALAAWVRQDDAVDPAGTPLLFVHGSIDRVAPLGRVVALARRLNRVTRVRVEVVEGGKHAMLTGHRQFTAACTAFVTEVLPVPSPADRRR
jgi:pimeloyl-ACP methyl ester carboxylesterase